MLKDANKDASFLQVTVASILELPAETKTDCYACIFLSNIGMKGGRGGNTAVTDDRSMDWSLRMNCLCMSVLSSGTVIICTFFIPCLLRQHQTLLLWLVMSRVDYCNGALWVCLCTLTAFWRFKWQQGESKAA